MNYTNIERQQEKCGGGLTTSNYTSLMIEKQQKRCLKRKEKNHTKLTLYSVTNSDTAMAGLNIAFPFAPFGPKSSVTTMVVWEGKKGKSVMILSMIVYYYFLYKL